jgi:hypothetical protein
MAGAIGRVALGVCALAWEGAREEGNVRKEAHRAPVFSELGEVAVGRDRRTDT